MTEAAADLPWSLGLMSGTSRDGIDAALIRSDGAGRVVPGPSLSRAYEPAFRRRLAAVCRGAGDAEAVERELTDLHAAAVRELLSRAELGPASVRVVGFHGHTVYHDPANRVTRQLGDGARLAALTGIRVVDDFRAADVMAGGQGAPFAPLYHAARANGLDKPLAVLNLGGVGNVTWLGADGRIIACDTGPGNALIDDLMLRRAGHACDRDGVTAAAGQVHEDILRDLLAHPFFAAPPPKSLDRDAFDATAVEALSLEDAAATLTAFTVRTVAGVVGLLPAPPRRWFVTGGGRHNPVLMAGLRGILGVPVAPVEEAGWNGDALEAEAFAYLALRSLRGLPLSLPETTGVPAPLTGGRLHAPPR